MRAIIQRPLSYKTETHTERCGSGDIRIVELIPELSEEERRQQRQSIAQGLYEVFEKYAEGRNPD